LLGIEELNKNVGLFERVAGFALKTLQHFKNRTKCHLEMEMVSTQSVKVLHFEMLFIFF